MDKISLKYIPLQWKEDKYGIFKETNYLKIKHRVSCKIFFTRPQDDIAYVAIKEDGIYTIVFLTGLDMDYMSVKSVNVHDEKYDQFVKVKQIVELEYYKWLGEQISDELNKFAKYIEPFSIESVNTSYILSSKAQSDSNIDENHTSFLIPVTLNLRRKKIAYIDRKSISYVIPIDESDWNQGKTKIALIGGGYLSVDEHIHTINTAIDKIDARIEYNKIQFRSPFA